MKYKIIYTESYERKVIGFLKKHPDVKARYFKTIRMLEENPFHPSLRLHKLKGRLNNMHSVSINVSYRISVEFIIEGNSIIPLDLGSHDEIY